MKNKQLLIIFSSIFVTILILTFVFIFVSKNKSQNTNVMPDITYVYTNNDFIDADLDSEQTRIFVDRLNTNYTWLKEDVDFEHYDIWIDIGNVKLALKDYEGAVEAWQYAIELNDINTLAYANLANYYKSFANDYDMAKYYYDLVVQKDSIGYFQDYLAYAELYKYYLPKDPAKVEIIMQAGAEKAAYQNKFDFYKYLYDFFTEEGDTAKAQSYKQQALEINPNFQF